MQIITKPTTMSSREIAELTGKRHADVLADIRNMLQQLDLHSTDFSAEYQDGTGRKLPMFNLTRELTETLLTGYSIPLRHKVILRWRELEEGASRLTAFTNDPRLDRIAQALSIGLIDKAEANRRTAVVLDEDVPTKTTKNVPRLAGRKDWRRAEPSHANTFGIGRRQSILFREVGQWVKGGQQELHRALIDGGFMTTSLRPTSKGIGLWAEKPGKEFARVYLREMLEAVGAWRDFS